MEQEDERKLPRSACSWGFAGDQGTGVLSKIHRETPGVLSRGWMGFNLF